MPKHSPADEHDDSLSYEAMLRTSMAEVKEPGMLPSGQWILRIVGAKVVPNEDRENDEQPIGTVMLTHVPVAPKDRDDGGPETADVEDGSWRGKRIFSRFNIRDRSDLFQVKQVLAGHGVSDEHDLEGALTSARGRQVEATVGLRTYKRRDGTTAKDHTLTNFTPA